MTSARADAAPHTTSAAEIRRASTAGGIALLLLAILAAFGHVGVVDGLVVEKDAVKTAANIADSETLFRLGLANRANVVRQVWLVP